MQPPCSSPICLSALSLADVDRAPQKAAEKCSWTCVSGQREAITYPAAGRAVSQQPTWLDHQSAQRQGHYSQTMLRRGGALGVCLRPAGTVSLLQ